MGVLYVRISANWILKTGETFGSLVSPYRNDPMFSAHSKDKHTTTNVSDSEAEDDTPPSSNPSQVIKTVYISSSNNASQTSSCEMHKESNDNDIFIDDDGQNGPSI